MRPVVTLTFAFVPACDVGAGRGHACSEAHLCGLGSAATTAPKACSLRLRRQRLCLQARQVQVRVVCDSKVSARQSIASLCLAAATAPATIGLHSVHLSVLIGGEGGKGVCVLVCEHLRRAAGQLATSPPSVWADITLNPN